MNIFRQARRKGGPRKGQTDRQTDQYPHRGNVWCVLQSPALAATATRNDNDGNEDGVLLFKNFRLTEFQGGLVKLCVHF